VRIANETPTALSDEARGLLLRLGGALEGAELPRRRSFRATLERAGAGGVAPEAPPERATADGSRER
jgi:hypothetical protein